MVVLTKTDLPHVEGHAEVTLAKLKAASGHGRVIAISSAGRRNLKSLLSRTSSLLEQVERREAKPGRAQAGQPRQEEYEAEYEEREGVHGQGRVAEESDEEQAEEQGEEQGEGSSAEPRVT